MRINHNIRKVFVFSCWLLIGSGVLVLLVAAINIKNQEVCRAVDIDISGVEEFFFLDKTDIRKSIDISSHGKPEGKQIAAFDLQHLEENLESNVWVKDAELFFDNNMILHVHISEREPVARIFTITGGSFFIDSSNHVMPLSDKMSVRLPVFTNFPTDKSTLNKADRELMQQVKTVAMYISKDDFFKAQVAQVDITPSRNFEMIPTIGNHIIEFGTAENAENKFRRLFLFYRQVLSQSGFDHYSRISVMYNRQVIGTKNGYALKVDSILAIRVIQKLIEDAKKPATDSVFTSVDKNTPLLNKPDSTLSVNINKADTESTKKKIVKPKAIMPVLVPRTGTQR